MQQAKRHRGSRAADIYHGDSALQFVVSRLVKEVAESDHANVFAHKIKSQSGRAAAEHAGYRI